MSVSRRELVKSLLAGVALAGVGGVGCRGCRGGFDPVVETLWAAEQAQTLGERWLKVTYKDQDQPEPEAKELLAQIFDDAPPAQSDYDAAAVREQLAAKIREDFTQDRTTWLDNWLLSNTELAVYGYVALIS